MSRAAAQSQHPLQLKPIPPQTHPVSKHCSQSYLVFSLRILELRVRVSLHHGQDP